MTRPAEPHDPDGPPDDVADEAPPRPPLPLEEMGGDPACWLGLVEDHRDTDVP